MKILLINPISISTLDSLAISRVADLNLPLDVEVVCRSLNQGPESVETLFDETFSAASVLDYVLAIKGFDYDAVVVNCFADPGVDGLRELLDVPVIGAGSSALYLAAMIAQSFSIISVQKNSVPHARNRLASMGLTGRVSSIYAVEIPVLGLHDSRQDTLDAILLFAEKAVKLDGSDAIVLGCTGMADVVSLVEKEIGVPVIDPTGAGIWAAVAMRSLGIVHGRQWMYLPADPGKLRRK